MRPTFRKWSRRPKLTSREDKRRKALVEAHNQADAAIYSAENADTVALEAAMQGIQKTYCRLAKKLHPDLNPGNKTAEDKSRKFRPLTIS